MTDPKTTKVIDVARDVFLRHGYKRVTMGDIATAAGMSRPALYLVYASKEEIFTAALDRFFVEALREVRIGLDGETAIDRKLMLAFEIWCVRTFQMVLASPDAKDLLESGHTFATELVDRNFDAFEHLVAAILKPLVKAQTRVKLPAIQIARLMVAGALGFKQTAKDVAQLRQMIAGLIAIVLASLHR
jgi:AcrR family transcriptional regulator